MPYGIITNARKVFAQNQLANGATQDLVALDDASFEFEQGEIVSLLGPSGCGKTTLLRIIAGLLARTSGDVSIGGKKIDGPYEDYGFIFQSPGLMPWRTVIDNVLFPMDVLKKNDAKAKSRAMDLLHLVGLNGFEKARPHQLSGGMQQRVSLCRALIHKPKLLLMDEPFGALDELTRMEMNDLLLSIRKETQAAVLFVTHSISEAIYLADKVLVFSKRPARIALSMAIDLGTTRSHSTRFSTEFMQAERRASEALGIVKPELQVNSKSES